MTSASKMEIMPERHIYHLLLYHRCVVVPGFGAFLTQPVSAYINPTDNTIHPPAKKIAFNRELTTDDVLLTHHISKKEKLSFSRAGTLVKEKALRWKDTLQHQGKLTLDGLGTITVDRENKWLFSADRSQNFQLSSFGLSAVTLSPVEKTRRKSPKRAQLLKGKSQKVIFSAAASLAVVLLFSFLWWQFATVRNPVKSELNFFQLSANHPISENTFGSIPHPSKKEKPKPVKSTLKPEPHTVNSKTDFFVIGGSFKSFHNALSFSKALKSKDYQGKIMSSGHGFFRVSYHQYEDSLKAVNFVKKIRKSENPSAWVLKK